MADPDPGVSNVAAAAAGDQFASIIIPVYDQPGELRTCLQAVMKQTYPRERFEVIVVDNGSKEDIRSVTEEFPGVAYVHHAKPGSYSARNRGVQMCRGGILVFTDADCVPMEHWLGSGIDALLRLKVEGTICGNIELLWADGRGPRSAAGYWEQVFAFNNLNHSNRELRHAVTANFFLLRRTYDMMQGFREDLMSGGDTEFSNRLRKQGYKIIKAKDALIRHPAREGASDLISKRLRIYSNLYFRQQGSAQGNKFLFFLRKLWRSYLSRNSVIIHTKRVTSRRAKLVLLCFQAVLSANKVLELVRLSLGRKARRK